MNETNFIPIDQMNEGTNWRLVLLKKKIANRLQHLRGISNINIHHK